MRSRLILLVVVVAALLVGLWKWGSVRRVPAQVVQPAADGSTSQDLTGADTENTREAQTRPSPSSVRVQTGSPFLTEKARAGAGVRMRFVDQHGEPIRGVEVTNEPIGSIGHSDASGVAAILLRAWTVTTDDGEPSPPLASVVGFNLRCIRAGYVERIVEGKAELEKTTDVGDVVLAPAARVHGSVTDEHGKPIENAFVECTADFDDGGTSHALLDRLGDPAKASTHTDASGLWSLDTVPGGRCRLCAWADGFEHAWTKPVDLVTGVENGPIDIRLPAIDGALMIDVRVVDPYGDPVEWFRVELQLLCAERDQGSSKVTNPGKGCWRLILERSCPVNLVAWDRKCVYGVAFAENVVPGSGVVEMKLSDLVEKDLVVVDESGRNVGNYVARILDASGRVVRRDQSEIGERCFFQTSRQLGKGGTELLFGSVRTTVVVDAPGYQPLTLGPFAAGAVPDPILATLQARPGLTGIVRCGGAPCADAEVTLHEVETVETYRDRDRPWTDEYFPQRSDPSLFAQATTRDDGRFDLPFEHEGNIYVRVSRDGFAPTELGPFDTSGKRIPPPLDVELDQGGTITGRVLDPAGTPLSGIRIGASRGDGYVEHATSGPSGEYQLSRLCAGRWLVRALATMDEADREPDAQRSELPWSCEVRSGAPTHFDLVVDARVRVRCHLVIDGKPATGWTGRLTVGTQGREGEPVEMDAKGGCVLLGRKSGRCIVQLQGEEILRWSVTSRFDLVSGDTVRDLAFETGSVDVHSPGSESWRLRTLLGSGFEAATEMRSGNALFDSWPAGLAILEVPAPGRELQEWTEVARVRVPRGARATVSMP